MQTFPAENLKYVYSPWHEPVGTVQPGERFTVDTQDCFTGPVSYTHLTLPTIYSV